jgi:hypothetical protein
MMVDADIAHLKRGVEQGEAMSRSIPHHP